MSRVSKVVVAGALVALLGVGTVAPAEAHGDAGAAVVAGLVGAGLGAAIASDHPHRHYYYEGYAPPPPPRVVYYAPPPPPAYAYDYVEHCRVFDRWDGWAGRYVRTRRCW
ncbi:hypothetical protein [Flavisphingomonas formosensis]|uniref:hypothetical protein n=1 Tax=Flavisphingomonas formosensis TaxID=861534 RepID=UPI0012F7C1C9|nr:hypothetical protein [Sphingomonas formosensis]